MCNKNVTLHLHQVPFNHHYVDTLSEIVAEADDQLQKGREIQFYI